MTSVEFLFCSICWVARSLMIPLCVGWSTFANMADIINPISIFQYMKFYPVEVLLAVSVKYYLMGNLPWKLVFTFKCFDQLIFLTTFAIGFFNRKCLQCKHRWMVWQNEWSWCWCGFILWISLKGRCLIYNYILLLWYIKTFWIDYGFNNI